VQTWRFHGDDGDARAKALLTRTSFDEIAIAITQHSSVLCGHIRRCDDRDGYRRATFCVRVPPQIFDAFFNAPSGYRGSYFQSEHAGLAANRQLLDLVSPLLLRWMRVSGSITDRDLVEASLAAPSAKAWLSEVNLGICDGCQGEWDRNARAQLQIANGRWELDEHAHAIWGRQAYLYTNICFFGGFLRNDGDEWVADHKTNRAHAIWARGWS
jgi:hypothetical protein